MAPIDPLEVDFAWLFDFGNEWVELDLEVLQNKCM